MMACLSKRSAFHTVGNAPPGKTISKRDMSPRLTVARQNEGTVPGSIGLRLLVRHTVESSVFILRSCTETVRWCVNPGHALMFLAST